MSKETLAVIGAKSMVGSRFCELARDNFEIIKADLPQVNLLSQKSIEDFFSLNNFQWIILFAAFTDVNEAEKQREDRGGSCWQINVQGVRNIADMCRKFNRFLVFISTDFVFDGTGGSYDENDPTGPDLDKVSWYGITKIEAEKIVSDNLPNSIILRIAYPYRGPFSQKDDIAKRILRLAKEGDLYPMFSNQAITPTLVDDLAPSISLLLQKNQRGIWHVASPKVTTQYEFAQKVLTLAGLDASIVQEGSIVEFLKKPDSTPRSIKGGLKTNKIKSLGFTPTDWDKGLEIVFRQANSQLI